MRHGETAGRSRRAPISRAECAERLRSITASSHLWSNLSNADTVLATNFQKRSRKHVF